MDNIGWDDWFGEIAVQVRHNDGLEWDYGSRAEEDLEDL
jgi:hypothetical protein